MNAATLVGFLAAPLVYALVLALHLVVPAREVDGYVRDEVTGKPLRYRLNGLRVFFVVIALAVLAVVGVAVGIFVVTRPDKADEGAVIADGNEDLYERGQINITGTAGILPPPPRTTGRRNGGGGGGGGSHGGGGGGMSYEEAMNQAVNLGDVSGGGGGERNGV